MYVRISYCVIRTYVSANRLPVICTYVSANIISLTFRAPNHRAEFRRSWIKSCGRRSDDRHTDWFYNLFHAMLWDIVISEHFKITSDCLAEMRLAISATNKTTLVVINAKVLVLVDNNWLTTSAPYSASVSSFLSILTPINVTLFQLHSLFINKVLTSWATLTMHVRRKKSNTVFSIKCSV